MLEVIGGIAFIGVLILAAIGIFFIGMAKGAEITRRQYDAVANNNWEKP